jgi:hypothetical protein
MTRPHWIRRRLLVLAVATVIVAGLGSRAAAGSTSVPNDVDATSPLVHVNGGVHPFDTRLVNRPSTRSEATRLAGTLELRGALSITSSSGSRRFGADCAPGMPPSVECFDVRGSGTVRGLGRVSLASLHFVDTDPAGCPSGSFAVPGADMRISVAGKGAIELRLDAAAGCKTLATVLSHTRSFEVLGGTGAYSGATGAGTVRREAGFAGGGARGTDFVKGTLAVPQVDFDLVPPSITGATSKTVRAAGGAAAARVRYSVKAVDARDGAVPIRCKPKSGATFRVGRTRVTCTATDTSGNARVASFWVTVRRGS